MKMVSRARSVALVLPLFGCSSATSSPGPTVVSELDASRAGPEDGGVLTGDAAVTGDALAGGEGGSGSSQPKLYEECQKLIDCKRTVYETAEICVAQTDSWYGGCEARRKELEKAAECSLTLSCDELPGVWGGKCGDMWQALRSIPCP